MSLGFATGTFPWTRTLFLPGAAALSSIMTRRSLLIGEAGSFRAYELEKHEPTSEDPVANHLDVSADMSHGKTIITGVVRSNAHQAGSAPVNTGRNLDSKLVLRQESELGPVIEQPIEVKQTLIDQTRAHSPLVFDNDGHAAFVQTQRVNTATVLPPRRVFGGNETDSENGVKMPFNEGLK